MAWTLQGSLKGPKGDRGNVGPAGPNGPTGPTGPKGNDGLSFTSGKGQPTGTAAVGTTYLDVSSGDVYTMTA